MTIDTNCHHTDIPIDSDAVPTMPISVADITEGEMLESILIGESLTK